MALKHNSIRRRFLTLVMAFLIPLLFILNLSNLYYCHLSQKQAAQSGADLISLYLKQTDKSIEEIADTLCAFATSDYIVRMLNSEDEATRQYALVELQSKLSSLLSNFDVADSLFVYGVTFPSYNYVYGAASSYSQRVQQEKHLARICLPSPEAPKLLNWSQVTLEDKNYLLWMIRADSVYVGAWIAMNTLEAPLNAIANNYRAQFVFTDMDNHPLTSGSFIERTAIQLLHSDSTYYRSGTPKKYILTGAPSVSRSFRLYMAFPEQTILENLDFLQWMILILSISALLLIPAVLHLFRHNLLNPLRVLNEAVVELEGGNLYYQIEKTDAPSEFLQINAAFNAMTVRLRNHKIKAYEDRLEKQKLKLAYLKMQIRPHFFLNALTTVSNFAALNRPEQMSKFIGYLAEYLRYMFRSNLTLVQLKEEIGHIETYLGMQELRFQGTLSHLFEVEPAAYTLKIPPFTIHNFVENVVKHAMGEQNHVMLCLHASVRDGMLRIVVEDNGGGLTAEGIRQLSDTDYTPRKGYSVGIWNIRQTLAIVYRGKASITITPSALSGTKVEICIPADAVWKGEETDENPDF